MAFLDGELSAVEAQTVSAHLKDCGECALVAEQFRTTSEVLSRWDVEAAPVALEDSVRKLAAHRAVVKLTSTGFSGSPRFRGRSLMIGSGAVALMTLLTVVVFLRSPRQSPPSAEMTLGDKAIAGNVQPRPSGEIQRQATRLPPMDSLAGAGVARIGRPDFMMADIAPTAARAASAAQLEASSTPAPMIARSAWLVIRVKDVEASRSSLDSILARHHGYPAQLNLNSPENGPRGFQASLRIPAAELASVVGEIKSLGRAENESQSGEDVTRQHADLGARLKTARATEERFRAILEQRTGKISDVLEVERSIAGVRGEIEAMEAEQKTLEHRVDFASVEIQLSEEYKAQLSSPDSASTRVHNAFVAGYRNARETLLGFLLFFEEYGPSLVIWLLVLALPVLLIWRRYRRVRSVI
jgi:anti-sigma factor RsiW